MGERTVALRLIEGFVSEYAARVRSGISLNPEESDRLKAAATTDPSCPEVLAMKAIIHALDGKRELAIVAMLSAFHELREELEGKISRREPRVIRDGG